MIITDFFRPEEILTNEALVQNTYEEVREQFEDLFKLDEFPDLMVDGTFDASKPTQSFAWLGTRLELQKDTTKVKAIVPDTIVVPLVPYYTYIIELGIDRLLNDIQIQAVLKEFIKTHIIYNLIKTHDMKYEYDRFIGADGTKPQQEIMQHLIIKEGQLHYYKALQDFYLEKCKDNHIGIVFTNLFFMFIEYLSEHKTVKGMGKHPVIMVDVWDIAKTVKELY